MSFKEKFITQYITEGSKKYSFTDSIKDSVTGQKAWKKFIEVKSFDDDSIEFKLIDRKFKMQTSQYAASALDALNSMLKKLNFVFGYNEKELSSFKEKSMDGKLLFNCKKSGDDYDVTISLIKSISESVEMSSLIYAAKKDKDKTIMVMLSNGKHFSITLDQILDSDSDESVFGCDEDGEEHEIFLKNISKIVK